MCSVRSSVASCSIISECTHCIFLTVAHCNIRIHMPNRGACIHSDILSLCTVSYRHTTIVAYVCAWFVVTWNADIQHSLFKTKPVLLLMSNNSHHCPFLWFSLVSPSSRHLPFAVQISFTYLYLSAINHSFDLGFILMFVLLNQTAMHASVYRMECLKYLLTESYFIWKIHLYEVQKGALGLCGKTCVHAKTRNCTFLKLFRWIL